MAWVEDFHSTKAMRPQPSKVNATSLMKKSLFFFFGSPLLSERVILTRYSILPRSARDITILNLADPSQYGRPLQPLVSLLVRSTTVAFPLDDGRDIAFEALMSTCGRYSRWRISYSILFQHRWLFAFPLHELWQFLSAAFWVGGNKRPGRRS
jgi:hypothetical protein